MLVKEVPRSEMKEAESAVSQDFFFWRIVLRGEEEDLCEEVEEELPEGGVSPSSRENSVVVGIGGGPEEVEEVSSGSGVYMMGVVGRGSLGCERAVGWEGGGKLRRQINSQKIYERNLARMRRSSNLLKVLLCLLNGSSSAFLIPNIRLRAGLGLKADIGEGGSSSADDPTRPDYEIEPLPIRIG